MLIDIKNFHAIVEYDLTLCKPYGEPIASLNRKIKDLLYKGTFLGTDEVYFNVPYYISSEDKESNIKNPIWDLIKGDYLVRIKNLFISNDEYKVFLVKNISENKDDSGEIKKSVVLYSLENQLADKRIVDYSGESRLIYDPLNRVDENGLEIGFLNHIFNRTSWSIGTVSSDYSTRYRAVNITNATMFRGMLDVAKTFDCVYTFDTINKRINVHSLSEIGSNNDAYLTDRNFITALKKDINNDSVKTRLFLYGKDKISIQKINPLGQPYIDNFNYFKNTDYMTQDLIDALNSYDIFYNSKRGIFETAIAELDTLRTEMSQRETTLWERKAELTQLEDMADIYLATNDPQYSQIRQQIANKNVEVTNATNQVKAKQAEIDAQFTVVENLRNEMGKQNHFTKEQLDLLDSFVKEETYTNNDYVESQLQELLEFGEKTLQRISTPSINFDIDVIDFLTLLEYQGVWKQFNKGDLVRIVNEELNFDMVVRFVGYEHDYESNSLKLKFTNKDSLEDSTVYLEELFSDARATASTVNWNRFDWAKGKDAQTSLEEFIKGNLDLARQKVVSGENQKTVMDERGIWLVKENPNGSIDPNQIRMVNNVIALTNDNWDNVEVAISPENGINANLIRGVLGEFVTLNANQINVSPDFGGSDLSKAIDNKIGVPLDETKTIYQLLMEKDSEMTIHRGAYMPTLLNEPAMTWVAEQTEQLHLGDVFIDTTSGKMYEFNTTDGNTNWGEITNQSIIDAVNQVKGEVNKVVLSSTIPTGSFLNGDLWIMPSGATFTYDTSKATSYRWRLTSPNLQDLAEVVIPEMRAEGVRRGMFTESSTTLFRVYISSSSGNNYFTVNMDTMTGTWNGVVMPELWLAFIRGMQSFTNTYGIDFQLVRASHYSASTTSPAYYHVGSSTYYVLNRNPNDTYIWHTFSPSIKQGVEYNSVSINPKEGIVIKNSSNQKMIQLGLTDNVNYGLSVYNSNGTREIVQVGRKGTQQGIWVNNNSGTNILKMGTSDNNYSFSVMDGSSERLRMGSFQMPNSSSSMYGFRANHTNNSYTVLDNTGIGKVYPGSSRVHYLIPFNEVLNFNYRMYVNSDYGDPTPLVLYIPPEVRGRYVYIVMQVADGYIGYRKDYITNSGWYEDSGDFIDIGTTVEWLVGNANSGYGTWRIDHYGTVQLASDDYYISIAPRTRLMGKDIIDFKGTFFFWILG